MENKKEKKNEGLTWMNKWHRKMEIISSLQQSYRNKALFLRVKTILSA